MAVILIEFYYIATGPLYWAGKGKAYQRELLDGIRKSAQMARSSGTEEELVENFNAIYFWHLNKGDVLGLPKRKRGRYSDYFNGSHVPLEWKLYDVDTIPGYCGRLEIGLCDGQLVKVQLVYTLCEGE